MIDNPTTIAPDCLVSEIRPTELPACTKSPCPNQYSKSVGQPSTNALRIRASSIRYSTPLRLIWCSIKWCLFSATRSNATAVAFDRVAENRHHFIEHQISLNGVEYRIEDALIRSAFVDGCPTDFEYWLGQGDLVQAGSSVGRISLTRQSGAMVVGLSINNENFVLETYPLCN